MSGENFITTFKPKESPKGAKADPTPANDVVASALKQSKQRASWGVVSPAQAAPATQAQAQREHVKTNLGVRVSGDAVVEATSTREEPRQGSSHANSQREWANKQGSATSRASTTSGSAYNPFRVHESSRSFSEPDVGFKTQSAQATGFSDTTNKVSPQTSVHSGQKSVQPEQQTGSSTGQEKSSATTQATQATENHKAPFVKVKPGYGWGANSKVAKDSRTPAAQSANTQADVSASNTSAQNSKPQEQPESAEKPFAHEKVTAKTRDIKLETRAYANIPKAKPTVQTDKSSSVAAQVGNSVTTESNSAPQAANAHKDTKLATSAKTSSVPSVDSTTASANKTSFKGANFKLHDSSRNQSWPQSASFTQNRTGSSQATEQASSVDATKASEAKSATTAGQGNASTWKQTQFSSFQQSSSPQQSYSPGQSYSSGQSSSVRGSSEPTTNATTSAKDATVEPQTTFSSRAQAKTTPTAGSQSATSTNRTQRTSADQTAKAAAKPSAVGAKAKASAPGREKTSFSNGVKFRLHDSSFDQNSKVSAPSKESTQPQANKQKESPRGSATTASSARSQKVRAGAANSANSEYSSGYAANAPHTKSSANSGQFAYSFHSARDAQQKEATGEFAQDKQARSFGATAGQNKQTASGNQSSISGSTGVNSTGATNTESTTAARKSTTDRSADSKTTFSIDPSSRSQPSAASAGQTTRQANFNFEQANPAANFSNTFTGPTSTSSHARTQPRGSATMSQTASNHQSYSGDSSYTNPAPKVSSFKEEPGEKAINIITIGLSGSGKDFLREAISNAISHSAQHLNPPDCWKSEGAKNKKIISGRNEEALTAETSGLGVYASTSTSSIELQTKEHTAAIDGYGKHKVKARYFNFAGESIQKWAQNSHGDNAGMAGNADSRDEILTYLDELIKADAYKVWVLNIDLKSQMQVRLGSKLHEYVSELKLEERTLQQFIDRFDKAKRDLANELLAFEALLKEIFSRSKGPGASEQNHFLFVFNKADTFFYGSKVDRVSDDKCIFVLKSAAELRQELTPLGGEQSLENLSIDDLLQAINDDMQDAIEESQGVDDVNFPVLGKPEGGLKSILASVYEKFVESKLNKLGAPYPIMCHMAGSNLAYKLTRRPSSHNEQGTQEDKNEINAATLLIENVNVVIRDSGLPSSHAYLRAYFHAHCLNFLFQQRQLNFLHKVRHFIYEVLSNG